MFERQRASVWRCGVGGCLAVLLGALAAPTLGQVGGVESFDVEIPGPDPSTNPPPASPPAPPPLTISGQTLLLSPTADQSIGAVSWPLIDPAAAQTIAVTFVPAASTPLTFETVVQPESELQVMWTLSSGSAAGPDGVLMPAGALRADVRHTRVVDGQTVCSTHAAVSLIPVATALDIQRALAGDPGTPIDPNSRRFCLGSSCSCPRCDNGVLFAAPFFIIGVCNRPEGIDCCRSACDVACLAHGGNNDMAEAWIIGQGQFVLCMLLNAPD